MVALVSFRDSYGRIKSYILFIIYKKKKEKGNTFMCLKLIFTLFLFGFSQINSYIFYQMLEQAKQTLWVPNFNFRKQWMSN